MHCNTSSSQRPLLTALILACSKGRWRGGGARQEREDLRELFEMEMGQLENRYETPKQRRGGSPEQQEEANKLEELARRQEGLTRAQRNLARREDQMTEEQKRRELERLMRQQEQLSREAQQLAQQMSRGQQSSQSQSGQQSQTTSTILIKQFWWWRPTTANCIAKSCRTNAGGGRK
ncbi:MAG: hypothetical protein CM1200mP40_11650 [Gammaproteobacteria bacterium]|nr:MAG: hypothetical protein CM1200mP40_11650 [Gammaproteobacteria bacterium]